MEAMNLARVKSCLEAMHQFGQVIEIFLNVSDAVAFVWGPMKFIFLAQYRLYQDDVADFRAKLEENVQREETKKLMLVKDWLAVGELPRLDHESYCKIRNECATTTKWVTQHETIKHWIHADIPNSPVVWVYGIPGAGKTILTSAIVEECKTKTDFITCFFYCHDGDPTSSTAVGILKGLADQLLDHYPQMLPPCYTRRSSSGEPSLRSLNQAKRLFEDFCFTIPKLFIIVDGLDECERAERSQLLDMLTELVGQRDAVDPGTIRLLIASQDHADIRRGLHSSAITKIAPKMLQISEKDNEGDIKAYTRMWVDRIEAKFPLFTEDMKEYLRHLIVANAKGMFLYAKLVLLDLHACMTLAELLDYIKTENFPPGLAQALVCAKRRLTWKEIQVALSIDVDYQTIDYEHQHLRDHIYETCGSLVLVNGDRVSLVHSTAKTYITNITEDIHEPSIECELATLCLQYLTFPCFDIDGPDDQAQRRRYVLDGSIAFQDYAIAKWFHHVNAWVGQGERFLDEANDATGQLQSIFKAMDDFMTRYGDVDWSNGLVDDCKTKCRVFEHLDLHDHLVELTSHIYTFQQKGFDAQHKISIEDLSKALERNRKALEIFPKSKPGPTAHEKEAYKRFYDEERRFKCTRITCRYFSEGFKDEKARNRHVNIHERPFQCEVPDCLGAEGFANAKDLERHTRAFHPEMSDLAEKFITATTKREASTHACTMCGKTFSRNFHRKNHELSHRGERPHECPECGKAFTRLNDLKRHQKIHDRK
ncbi:hypothetical protein J4E83_009443 [Alternaria metachromatica]|uniref:uncharacterized protein n=1 Tax=Alternaria metachromatica TaxID=283354 RepID=UPI0020C3F6A5|nr:uncharacterized protein J4E83_009443 [Alternaria metachromatica]KAI4607899.1 hypothetical protein J4E83_009443 [Alternaria metachromatica]